MVVSQMVPLTLFSTLLLARAHRVLVKSSAIGNGVLFGMHPLIPGGPVFLVHFPGKWLAEVGMSQVLDYIANSYGHCETAQTDLGPGFEQCSWLETRLVCSTEENRLLNRHPGQDVIYFVVNPAIVTVFLFLNSSAGFGIYCT